jgi:hypothetical protein
MKTHDLFKTSSKHLNESLQKTFGKKLNLETFDLDRLQDARNKLRTQISQVRNNSEFNENLENDAFHQAQWMLDAINAEIAEREEFAVDSSTAEASYEEGKMSEIDIDLQSLANRGDEEDLIAALDGDLGPGTADVLQNMMDELKDELASKGMNDVINDDDKMIEMLWDKIVDDYGGDDSDEGGETDDEYALASAGFGSDEDYESIQREDRVDEKSVSKSQQRAAGIALAAKRKGETPPGKGAAAEMAKMSTKELEKFAGTKHKGLPAKKEDIDQVSEVSKKTLGSYIKKASQDKADSANTAGFKAGVKQPAYNTSDASDKEMKRTKGIDRAISKLTKEQVDQGEDMTKLQEGEIQQASAIVTAKTMVDRVGRWIEELSGMENDTLLQLGDSIRDEIGQEQAKAFIEAVAPAIQQALETLKGTRDSLSNSVRTLATGEQPADMLGAEPAAGGEEEMGPVEPDAMNMPTDEPAADEFAAAEPAAGGAEAPGREQRESIQFQSRLLKVLAG